MMSKAIDINRSGLQRLSCGCTVEIRHNSPLWDALCPEASGLFGALIKSPDANKRECAERDALRAHIGMEATPQSGYTSCACRDCMEIIVANNPARPELCGDCNTAGCGDPGAQGWPECQRDDAYGEA